MQCPIDHQTLVQRRYEWDIVIDECPACHGVWLEAGELERIQNAVEHDYGDELRAIPDSVSRAYAMAREKSERERRCPVCDRTLDRKEYGYASRILIDVCASCQGVWLDRGELEALEVFFERARHDTRAMRLGFFGSLRGLLRR